MVYTTEVSRHVEASRATVYRTLLDPDAVAKWRVPDDMRGRVHEFEPREGGRFRISLTYEAPDGVGKTSDRTDTYHGRFTRLVRDELITEEIEFETDDPALQGTMTLTTTLTEVPGGTEVRIRHEGIPDSIPAADNELGTQMSLANLARAAEAPDPA